MDLSIIIVSYNTKKLLENCLASVEASLKGSAFSSEVMVVDNASTDGTREMLEDKFAWVRRIYNDGNVGFGRANNQGIGEAVGTTILLLNSDCVVIKDAIVKLYNFSQTRTRAFVGAKLLNTDKSTQTSCGPFFSLPVVFAALFLKGDKIGLTRWSPNSVRRVDWVSGACLMAPKRLFLDDLLFDENIFMYMDEIDLLYRAKKKSYPAYFYPYAKIIHVGSGSSTSKRKGPVINIFRGLVYFYKKHADPTRRFILQILLKTKAAAAWLIGIVSGNKYLTETYGEAFRLV